MLTVTFVVHERPGTDLTSALEYWRTTHADLVRQIPGVRSYVQHHATGAPDGRPPFLGIASMSFDDEAAFATAAASPQFAAAVGDLANFADPEALPTAFTQDVVLVS